MFGHFGYKVLLFKQIQLYRFCILFASLTSPHLTFAQQTYHVTPRHITPHSGISRLHSKHITSSRDISRHTVAYHVCNSKHITSPHDISRHAVAYHVCTANISRRPTTYHATQWHITFAIANISLLSLRCISPFPLDLLKRMRYNNDKLI